MSARDDYALFAPLEQYDTMTKEIDQLRRWKAEALEVLAHWDAVTEQFDLSGHLGKYQADAVLVEIKRLQEQNEQLKDEILECIETMDRLS